MSLPPTLQPTHDAIVEFAKEQTVAKARKFFAYVFVGPASPWVMAMPPHVRAALADLGEALHGRDDARVRMLRR